MIVTIDGPAGAGKSTVARNLAGRLGFQFLDTGAMYRAVTLAALRAQTPWDDAAALAGLAASIQLRLAGDSVWLGEEDVSVAIREPRVNDNIYHVADNIAIRRQLVQMQRDIAADLGDVVTEGRDQGTEAFPDAQCKIFLTASPETRALRRLHEMQERNQSVDVEEVLRSQTQRDQRDATRPVGALRKADDAIEVSTDGLSLEEVVEKLADLVQQRVSQ